MPNHVNHIDAYILAGGKSSRMGTDKGLLFFHDVPLIERIIQQLQPCFQRLTIISDNPKYCQFGLPVTTDLIKDIGPAGGIHAALNHTQSERIFATSCDMPFITTEAVQLMIENSERSQIVLPITAGKLQPLFGIYAKSCRAKWEQLITQRMIKLQEMVSHFDLSKIDLEDYGICNDKLFMNVNNKTDLDQALQQL
ncbi:MAG: molybdenum cofactor guanylyltransferase [Chitinophagaceae bacterium]|nr:molybdenum cofactor guanylyltransferase [Chitinophagaceae bacterium]